MTEWNLMLIAGRLKDSQIKLQESHTKITDALNGAWEEAALLDGVFKGTASENFLASFSREWEAACNAVWDTGKLIAAYTLVERRFEGCESQIAEMM